MQNASGFLAKLVNELAAYRTAGKTAEAIRTMRQILEHAPNWDHGFGWLDLAKLYIDNEEFEAALECCEKASKYAVYDLDDFVTPLTGLVLAHLGRFDESLSLINVFLREEVRYAHVNSECKLTESTTRYVYALAAAWEKRNANLWARLHQEIPEGTRYWRSFEDGK